jgi:hypothetical protein
MSTVVTKIRPFLKPGDFKTLEQLEETLRRKQLWAMATPPYPVSHGEVHIKAVMDNVAQLLQAIGKERLCKRDPNLAAVFQLSAAVLMHDLGMGMVASHTKPGPAVERQEHASVNRLKDYFESQGIGSILSTDDLHYATLIAWAHAGDDQFTSKDKADWIDETFRSRAGATLIPLCMRLLRFADLCDVGPHRLNPLPNKVEWQELQIPHLDKHRVSRVVLTDHSVELQLARPEPLVKVVEVSHQACEELTKLCRDIEQQFYPLQTCWLDNWDFIDHVRPGKADSLIRVSPNEEIAPELSIFVGDSVDVAVTPDGSRAICRGNNDRLFYVWDLEELRCVLELKGHDDKVNGIAVTPDGSRAVSASFDKNLKIWDLETGECKHTLKGHSDAVMGVAISPNGRTVVSGSYDNTLRSWDIESGEHLNTFEGHSSRISVWAVCITHNGDKVISGENDGQLRIWNISDGKCLEVIEAHNDRIYSVAVTADDSQVIAGCDDGSVKIWNLSTAEVRTFKRHEQEVCDVIVTADGKTVVSSSDDKTINLWNLESGQCIATLRGHTHAVTGLAITRGQKLVSTSKDGTLKIWPLSKLVEPKI